MKIKKILVPLDGSENSLKSLKQAADLAGIVGASITCLHVVTGMSAFAAVHPLIIPEAKWPGYVKDIMKDARRIASQAGIQYQEAVIGGMAAGYDIVTFADSRANAVDLIVIARRGQYLAREAFPGSTANFVIHKSRTPVLLVR
ncbi:MAG: universal stress protein [Thaumarchaeota archaeon]|nr:universal stress protein [Nitrososphaerota archaeon]